LSSWIVNLVIIPATVGARVHALNTVKFKVPFCRAYARQMAPTAKKTVALKVIILRESAVLNTLTTSLGMSILPPDEREVKTLAILSEERPIEMKRVTSEVTYKACISFVYS
jgi:hypothetical protein